jgi:hypothetical protein
VVGERLCCVTMQAATLGMGLSSSGEGTSRGTGRGRWDGQRVHSTHSTECCDAMLRNSRTLDCGHVGRAAICVHGLVHATYMAYWHTGDCVCTMDNRYGQPIYYDLCTPLGRQRGLLAVRWVRARNDERSCAGDATTGVASPWPGGACPLE